MISLREVGYNLMPTVARVGPYRLFFFSNEGTEPPHIHVQRARVAGFRAVELRRIERLVVSRQEAILEAWHEYFGA